MRISDILSPALIQLDLQAQDKHELFAEMVQMFVRQGLILDRESALATLLAREEKMSTGISRWLALPHGRLAETRGTLIALGVSKDGLEYDSLDGEPVYVVVMVFAEISNPGQQVQALAEIARLFAQPGMLEQVRKAKTPQQILEIIRREE